MVGGIFYIIGGALLAALVGFLGSGSDLLGSGSVGTGGVCAFVAPFPCDSNSSASAFGSGVGNVDMGGIADILLAVGVITGSLIIFSGWLINSESSGRRKAGCILAIIMILVGGLTTFGGLVIGFILAGIGVYLGLTYRSNGRGMVIGLGPVGSVMLGSQGPMPATGPAGTGPLNYCIKCGSQLREGAVFCGACGTRILE
jgi:hypothetical protein